MKTKIFISIIALTIFALFVVSITKATSPYLTYLPLVNREEQYPTDGWIIIDRWGNNAQTMFTLFHSDGWRLDGQCMNPSMPAPNIGDMCNYLGGGQFNCGGNTQNIIVVVLLITPTATNTPTPTMTNTPTPTYTLTPTELPTDTPEPTLPPPTGITDTPTPTVYR